MTRQIYTTQQRLKDTACVLLCLLPYFGFFALLLMGKKAKHPQFTRWGRLYGAAGVLLYIAMVFADCISQLRYMFPAAQTVLVSIRGNIQAYHPLLITVLWLAVMIHTFTSLRSYLLYMQVEAESGAPDPVSGRSMVWKLRNSIWMLWSFVPLWGGFSVWYAGSKLKKKGLARFGIGSVLATALLGAFCNFSTRYSAGSFLSSLMNNVQAYALIFLFIVHLILTVSSRHDYLVFRAKEMEADIRTCPRMGEGAWQRLNGRWQVWTFFPLLGGIGISVAGRRTGFRKLLWTGIAATVGFVLLLLVYSHLSEVWFDLVYPQRNLCSGMLDACDTLIRWLYLTLMFYGTLIRWDVLRARAKQLQGFYSETDREIALRRRTQPAPQPMPAEHTMLQPVVSPPVSQPRIEIPAGHIDLNRCSITELTSLPGVGIAQARRAMEHRNAKGSFTSVDEFVDLLEIKPHFAVQIFAMAAVETTAVPDTSKAAPNSRAIDL